MTLFITIPADVVPLLYSGLELEVWRLAEELDQAFDTREEDHGWFGAPLDRLDRTGELMRVIDWPQDHPPTEATVEIDTWRDILLAGLEAELTTLRDHVSAPCNGPDLRVEARRGIAVIEDFKARLPQIEAEGDELRERPSRVERSGWDMKDGEVAERAIILQVLRDDHEQRWSRVELEGEIYDIDPVALADALSTLRENGVIHLSGDLVWASRCARRLDDLGMVSI